MCLGRYFSCCQIRHKKHRFLSKQTPSLKHMMKCLDNAQHKFCWVSFFRDNDNSSGPIHPRMVYSKRIRPFSAGLPKSDMLHKFCLDFRKRMLAACASSLSPTYGRSKAYANCLPTEKIASIWLQANSYLPIPTDKDSGFCLVSESDCRVLQQELLQGPWTASWGVTWLPASGVSLFLPIFKSVKILLKSIRLLVCCCSLENGHLKACSRMIHTVKCHKPPGRVALKAVHASSGHSFLGLQSWVTMVLSGRGPLSAFVAQLRTVFAPFETFCCCGFIRYHHTR